MAEQKDTALRQERTVLWTRHSLSQASHHQRGNALGNYSHTMVFRFILLGQIDGVNLSKLNEANHKEPYTAIKYELCLAEILFFFFNLREDQFIKRQ